MELAPYFRSIIEQDRCAVVICDRNHTIIYMNPAAIVENEADGGAALIGKSIFGCHSERACEGIRRVFAWMDASPDHNIIHTFHNPKTNKDFYMVALRDTDGQLIGYYEKHEYRNADPMPFYDFR